jgi:peptidyl-prolyl cis-trans isomerase SurA
MKKLIAILVFLTSTTWLTAQGGEVMLDRVVAQVGSEIILLSDVEERVAQAKEQQGSIPEGIRCQIVESVMLGKLMVNQAKLDSIEVSDQMVDANLDQRFDYIMNLFNNDPEQFRAYYGRGIDEMREFMRAELKDDMIMQEMRRKITREIQITPKEVTEFYNAIPKDSLPYFNSEVEISELVYVPSANEEAKQEATDKLNDIKDRIKGGESFEELAKIYSDDFGSARNGGTLGWMKRGSLVPEYEAVAYNMEPNELSDVTESEFGFHLIQLLKRRGNSILTRHILVRPQITQDDLNTARELLDSIKYAVMHDSLAFEEAVKKFSHDKVQSYYNGGRVTNQATGNTFLK